jgi:hypothetical protein
MGGYDKPLMDISSPTLSSPPPPPPPLPPSELFNINVLSSAEAVFFSETQKTNEIIRNGPYFFASLVVQPLTAVSILQIRILDLNTSRYFIIKLKIYSWYECIFFRNTTLLRPL